MWFDDDEFVASIDEKLVETIAVKNNADRRKLMKGLRSIADGWTRISISRRILEKKQLKRLGQIERALEHINQLSADGADDFLAFIVGLMALHHGVLPDSFDEWLKTTTKILDAVKESPSLIEIRNSPNRRAIGEIATRRLVVRLAALYTDVTGQRFARKAARCQHFVADCMEALHTKPLSGKSVADYYWREGSIRRKKQISQ
jgi:hypothetical protein